jgi:hypothetical protein
MEFDKNQVLELLRSQGDNDKAQQADKELPDRVDPQKHAGILSQLGVNPQDLIGKLGGGGLGGMLGR